MIKTLILNPNKKILVLMSVSLVFFLLAFYIFQINNLVSNNYLLKSQQKSLIKLNQENERLAANLAGVGSLGSAEERVSELGFKKISGIHYIQILEGAVASAK
jgi:hypothetical protein